MVSAPVKKAASAVSAVTPSPIKKGVGLATAPIQVAYGTTKFATQVGVAGLQVGAGGVASGLQMGVGAGMQMAGIQR